MNRLNMRGWSGATFGGMARQTMGMSINPLNKQQPMPPQPMPAPTTDTTIYYSFNVPFASHLAGPDTEDILHATRDAIVRWTHSEEAPDDVPVWDLPVHAANVNMLEKMCAGLCNGPLPIDAYVISAISSINKRQVTTVVLSGSPDLVYKSRETILNDLPLSLRCTTVDIDGNMVADLGKGELKRSVLENLDHISANCGVDIFLLGPKLIPAVEGLGDTEMRRDQRFRVAIYGDVDSSEHAKTRVLILIDKMLGRIVDSYSLDPAAHALVCGRNKKNIKMIESTTGTAIYFPPPYSAISRYLAPGAFRRKPDEIFITGETVQQIAMAKARMQQTCNVSRVYAKDCHITPPKIESILFTRLDKIRKVLETNGNQVTWPPLASQRNVVRVHGSDTNTVERTIRELMYLSGQFYSATWHINPANLDPRQLPSGNEIRTMLVEVCSGSNADVSFDRGQFSLTGFDDAVKDALELMSKIPYLTQGPYQIRVKIELANEHKEFVSGKKNGKINKIMGQSNVQIVFDGFNEYNFHIDVVANSGYHQLKQGLGLVEAEMPASISFHVPDQYHKRIIGIGGQHIQRIMKKHSVFVKFSNAMDRGGMGREDEDVKVDNVVCRTPARNAQNLELVKNEILDMVDQADSELTSQVVHIDRLYHRQLISRMAEIDELEKRWNCKIIFPSTEQASDEVTISGPEWQVPHCVDAFLGMVPDQHELVLEETPGLVEFLQSPKFRGEICTALKNNYEVSISVRPNPDELSEKGEKTIAVTASFTRNCAGGLRDALDFIYNEFTTAGVTVSVVKGSLPRPKSDSFEESMPFFDSKLLQAPTAIPPESPGNKSTFGDEVARERSTIFDKLRKPSSMAGLSSFLDRRKNSSQSINTSFFKGSANVSKTSLISIESTRSFHADRNPWNDSGVNLPEDDSPWPIRPFSNGVDHKVHNNGTTPGDATPRHNTRPSADSGRPSTSHSANSGYPGAPAPFR